MAGSKMATRVAPSLLKAAGMDELIVDSLEAYEETAVALATDPERLFKVRSQLPDAAAAVYIRMYVARSYCRCDCASSLLVAVGACVPVAVYEQNVEMCVPRGLRL